MNTFKYYNKEKSIEYAWYNSTNVLYSEFYDNTDKPKELVIVFKNGNRYKYIDVSINDYFYFREGSSQGKSLNWLLKEKKWNFEKMEPADLDEITNEYNEHSKKGIKIYNEDNKFKILDNEDNVVYSEDTQLEEIEIKRIKKILNTLGIIIL